MKPKREPQRGKAHDDATRAAVIAALLAGQRVEEVAKEYRLPASTVRTWKRPAQAKFDELRAKHEEEFDELIFKYLRASVRSLAIQVEHFGDKDWLRAQSASELAVLHGVQTDKAVLLLTALERGAEGQTEAAQLP